MKTTKIFIVVLLMFLFSIMVVTINDLKSQLSDKDKQLLEMAEQDSKVINDVFNIKSELTIWTIDGMEILMPDDLMFQTISVEKKNGINQTYYPKALSHKGQEVIAITVYMPHN
jgi:hypothetical protein